MENQVSFVLFFITFSIHQFDAHDWMEREMNIRVPDFLEPERYVIDVTTDVMSEKPKYFGEVTVTVCITPTSEFTGNQMRFKEFSQFGPMGLKFMRVRLHTLLVEGYSRSNEKRCLAFKIGRLNRQYLWQRIGKVTIWLLSTFQM